jgi:hypothetical protein
VPVVLVLYVQLRIQLNDGRVAQIMGRGPYRVWFKGIDYPGRVGGQLAVEVQAAAMIANPRREHVPPTVLEGHRVSIAHTAPPSQWCSTASVAQHLAHP